MTQKSNTVFKDEIFPLYIAPERESGIDVLEKARKAIHEAVEIKYFYEGTSTLVIGRKTVEVTAGDLVVINPYEFHATVSYGKDKGKYHLFMVSPEFFSETDLDIPELKHKLLTGQISFTTKPECTDRIKSIISRAVEETQMQLQNHRLALRGIIYELFAILLRDVSLSSQKDFSRENSARRYSLVEPALRRIRDSYTERMSVEELSALCSVSKYHFCRVFKTVTGLTVMQYLNDYRLSIADTMIKNTNKSVAEISELCGFDDESYFCRLYKKRFGYTTGKRKDKDN